MTTTGPSPPAAAKALVAQGDRPTAAMLAAALVDLGYAVDVVHDGADARDALGRDALPALLVVDLSLPMVDGFALIEVLRRRAPVGTTRIVVVSAFAELRTVALERRDALGIDAVLAKGAPAPTVRRALERIAAPLPTSPARPARVVVEDVKVATSRLEQSRLAAVARLGLLDDAPEDEALQRLVQDTAAAFDVPIALVTLVLQDRQFFKAHTGLSGRLLADRGSVRAESFCRHVVVADHVEALVVPDAAMHPAFAQNPLVLDGTVRSYVGAPLVTSGGEVLGTLCIIDAKPRSIAAAQIEALVATARRVAGELELRAAAVKSGRMVAALQGELASVGESFAVFSSILEGLDQGVLLMNHERRIRYVNRAFAAMMLRAPDEIVGLTRDELLAALALRVADPDELGRLIAAPPHGPYAFQVEIELAQPARRVLRWSTKPVLLQSGLAQVAIIDDVTVQVDALRARETAALTDALTDVPNRRALVENLHREAARAARAGASTGVVMFDVDHFKRVNDQHGHGAGDDVLAAVARALHASGRGGDLLGRWGGEEFLAILPSIGLEGASTMAERARAAVCDLDVEGVGRVTVSAGVDVIAPGEPPERAVERADAKLYRAKEAGRNRVVS